MATLSRESRKALERVVLAARSEAEAGAQKALDQLAVAHHEAWATMSPEQQSLRRRLRARGRQLGDRLEGGKQSVGHLVAECAYEHWHRMLFARFLAECSLLIEPVSNVPVSVEECKELARESGVDWISLASAFAQGMLPQIFRADDAVLKITLPAEHRQPLEKLLLSLPKDVFLTDDSLGWVYQFWQSEEKEKVNKSGAKIGSDQLPAVTQLFTEDYMVDFLLDNTLGAWHAAKVLAAQPALAETAESEEELRIAVAIPGAAWTYLRFIRADAGKWTPAAGTFGAWPKTAKKLKCLDPCMGSGHFIVAMFARLVALRRVEEEPDEAATAVAVIRDNLFGLEIDPRCTQIAAFNLALTAWRRAGHCRLPVMNLACSGLAPNTREVDWLAVAGGNENLQRGMERLHRLFKDAPVLGSLINPRAAKGDLLEAAFHELQPLLEKALAQETKDDTAHEMAVTARGLAKAADILASRFALVATNVPYLSNRKQCDDLKTFCTSNYRDAKNDLAVTFLLRLIQLCDAWGSVALVMSQHWLFTPSYSDLRKKLLTQLEWPMLAKLGVGAFETITGEVVNVMAGIWNVTPASPDASISGLNAMPFSSPTDKAGALREEAIIRLSQAEQGSNAQSRVIIGDVSAASTLDNLSIAPQGVKTGDDERWRMCMWEIDTANPGWVPYQTTVSEHCLYGGRYLYLDWRTAGLGMVRPRVDNLAVGRRGVAISQIGDLPATLYTGERFDSNIAPLIPTDATVVPALWAYCSSNEYLENVRLIDQSLKVTNVPLIQVPFDLEYWRKVAAERYPRGLPDQFSSDSTQWLFDGHPKDADQPLHVAVARLLGYQWPRQTGSSFPDCPSLGSDGLESFAAPDGVVCISAVKGYQSAGERLQGLLAVAYDTDWNAATLGQLLKQVDCEGQTLERWLRDDFFDQHCRLFYQRPFIWHIWDGHRDGFSALVNSQRLTKANLEKLTYAYLGDWIRRQEAAAGAGEPGGDARFVAARQLQDELKKILQGEPPCDLFVRWKPLTKQPIGWEPDLNDGVRMNVRPFLMAADVGKKGAGILRVKPNISWGKDRGKEQARAKDEFPWFWGWDGKMKDFGGGTTFDGNRWNDLHYSRDFKMAARRQRGLA